MLHRKRTSSIVRWRVIKNRGEVQRQMDKQEFRSLLLYKSSMLQAKQLLRQGIITESEYWQFDDVLTKKYGLSLFSIFREKRCCVTNFER